MNQAIGKWVRLRIGLVALGLLVFGVWVCGRFFYLQGIRGPELREEATREYQKFCPILPVRGMILDRNGTELAVSTRVGSVVAHPNQIKHADRLSRQLAPILAYDVRELKEILTRARPFVWVKRHLTPEREEAFRAWEAAQEKKLRAARVTARTDMDAIYLVPEAKRYYPQLALAGEVLGFCNIDGQGLEGLEYQYDNQLYGKPKQCWNMRDARGHIVVTGEKAWDPEVMGNNVVLTLDRTLQYIAEKELARGVDSFHGSGGLAMVVRPQTGEILAMAQTPVMDPNRYTEYPEAARRNRLVTDCLEPGSTFKIYVAASALDVQAVKATDRFNCESGIWHLGPNEVIHDAHPYGVLTVQQVIQKSSNIGAAKIAGRLGSKRLDHCLHDFGFGRRSGLLFPGEAAGLVKDLMRARSAIDRATLAFGQGVSVTMLQMIMGLAAMGNDGVLMEPHLVKEIDSPRGKKVAEYPPRPVRRVLSQQAAHQILAIMETVTQPGGTAKEAAPAGFTVAGKTGTAQKLVGRAYSHSKFNAWFIGLIPADHPVLAIAVAVEEPKGAIYGGVVAAPIFREIAAQSMRILGYYPKEPPKDRNAPVLASILARPAAAATCPEGKPQAQTPALPKLEIPQGPLKVMPNVTGYTIRQVLNILNRSGMRCRFEGSGLAVSQEPEPGTALAPGATCVVKFQSSS
ncbi:MAG: penicillin-binding protein [Desulfobaccales bacterium]